ncbi:GntR family transcriptional regulator [Arthrobacter oryzae]|uniref:GntR family transcriptional regulator n=1 Tax=Arthrobacter oryzae TaxID=409290 RepID=UPI0027821D13|nr:GntR family transcriptional regulator [Arthrobacter oryzae]MDQ0079398.1 DNA-binding transcriptional regulator YhcF (GntR family) [Arthrobacter oryzae]
MLDDSRPIFIQIAELIEGDIVAGTLLEEAQAPSTNELAAFYRINPATAAKGINKLVDEGILYKKRGIGMFVATGARTRLLERRREEFYQDYIQPLTREAAKLGISAEVLTEMISRSSAEPVLTERSAGR